MIIEYSSNDSLRRQKQIKQIKNFSIPTWQAHFKQVDWFIEQF